jgi:D-serine deaminase-like pyridoxal phosphate-dependent protein
MTVVAETAETLLSGLPSFGLDIVDDTPEVVIDLRRVERIARAAATAAEHGVALRPHVKTHKLPPIAALQIEAGAVGIQVAKLGEAEVFAGAGIADIFVGYPLVGARKIARVIELLETTSVKISVAADALEVAIPIARAAAFAGLAVPVVIEVDTGLHRLGVQPGRATLEFASRLAELDGVAVAGLFTHEGHVYTQARSMVEKRAMTEAACAALDETADLVRASGIPLATVSVVRRGHSASRSGARTSPSFARERTSSTTSASSVRGLRRRTTLPRSSSVVGRPEATRAVIDAGSKVLTSDRLLTVDPGLTFGAVAGYPGAQVIRHSEEHGMLEFPAPADIRIGDRVGIVPNHICPVINLADSVSVVADGRLAERWVVSARGRVK